MSAPDLDPSAVPAPEQESLILSERDRERIAKKMGKAATSRPHHSDLSSGRYAPAPIPMRRDPETGKIEYL